MAVSCLLPACLLACVLTTLRQAPFCLGAVKGLVCVFGCIPPLPRVVAFFHAQRQPFVCVVCMAFCTGLLVCMVSQPGYRILATASDSAAVTPGVHARNQPHSGLVWKLVPDLVTMHSVSGLHHHTGCTSRQPPHPACILLAGACTATGVTARLAVVAGSGDCGRSRCYCPAAPQLQQAADSQSGPQLKHLKYFSMW